MTGTDLEPDIRCLADIVRVHARLRPGSVALECDGESLTFAEWYERAAAVAAALVADGVGPNARIAVLARNSLALFELTFGAALVGAVAVPVNWRLAPPEVLEIVNDAEAEILVVGGELVAVVERIEPELDQVRRLVSPGVTHAFMVPAVIQLLLAAPGVDRSDFRSLRKVVYGASPISESVLTRAIKTMGCELIQVYGLTETTGAIVQLDAHEHDPVLRPELLRSCGRPYPWVAVRIVLPDGSEAAEGEVGELWVRSPQVMAGYWRNPEATADAITADGWFRTGDAGYRDRDGYLYLYDRVKDMIVTGGENVYPAEAENALMAHPAVADAAAFGILNEQWGEAVKAVVVSVGEPPPAEALIASCRERIAGYKCPKSIDFAAMLPRNPSGKLLKRELRAPHWGGTDRLVG